jgi:acyl-[acyl-carrier-protein] desaturase
MSGVEPPSVQDIEELHSLHPPGLLSRAEKDRLIERGITGLYRWYLDRSQVTRNWNPDRHFNWRAFRTDHSPEMNYILEGFFAVEQYVPDYVNKLLQLIRKSYGRAQFQVRWGAEEQRHMDAWQNTVLFSRFRSPEWIEGYKEELRNREWNLPWDDAMHMLFYTLIQERATQINYLNAAALAAGKSDRPEHRNNQENCNDVDPVLEKVCVTIATDEAAHYNFFHESARLMFYYYPAQSLDALVDVIRHFAMPGVEIIPNFQRFQEMCARAGVYGPRQHAGDVLQVALSNLDVRASKAFSYGVKRSRMVPDPDGNMRDTALFEAIDYEALEAAVKRLYGRIEQHEQEIGYSDVDPTHFVPSGLTPQ